MQIAGKQTPLEDLNRTSLYVYTDNHINYNKHIFRIIDEDLHEVIFNKLGYDSHKWAVSKQSYMNFLDVSGFSLEQLKEVLNPSSYNYILKYIFNKGQVQEDVPVKDVTKDREKLIEESGSTNKQQTGKIMKALNEVKNNNLAAAKSAAILEVGKVLNKTLVAKIRPQLPMMARGYADHAFAEVVVANIASFAVANFAPKNEKALIATNAMMLSAMTEFVSSFNIETLIADVLDGIELPEIED